MKKMSNDFPYPVLRSDIPLSSGYQKECNLTVTIEDPVRGENCYEFETSVKINSESLTELISEGKAKVLITYQTKLLKKSFIANELNDIVVKVDSNIFQSIDAVNIKATVVAAIDLLLEYHPDYDESFDVGEAYAIKKGDILALSNECIFDYNKSGKTIIKIVKADDVTFKNGFAIDINKDDDFIIIKVNSKLKENYDWILTKESDTNVPLKTVVNSSLVHMAFINVFTQLCVEGTDNYKEKRWFKVIQSSLVDRNINLKEKISEISDPLDIAEVFNLTDVFLNHYFDKALNRCGEVLQK